MGYCAPSSARTTTVMKPFYTFGEYMTLPATRTVRHPSSLSTTQEENKKLSKGELVPLVTKEVDMDQFVNIDFDPNHMFKESSGVSHDDGVVLVDFASV